MEDANWNLILIPFWILYGFFVIVQFLLCLITKQRDILFELLQHICLFTGAILIVREWERAGSDGRIREDAEWNKLSTPFYLAVFLKTAALAERVRSLQRIQDKMISPEHMVTLVHKHRQEQIQQQQHGNNNNTAANDQEGGEDEEEGRVWSEDQWEEKLRQTFVVISPDEMTFMASVTILEQAGESLTDEEREILKVQASPEYHHIQNQMHRTSMGAAQVLIYGIIMVALIASKLRGKINNANWWIVFLPVWIYLGWQLCSSCFTCCCVVVIPPEDAEEEEEGDNDGNNDNDGNEETLKKESNKDSNRKEKEEILEGQTHKDENDENNNDKQKEETPQVNEESDSLRLPPEREPNQSSVLLFQPATPSLSVPEDGTAAEEEAGGRTIVDQNEASQKTEEEANTGGDDGGGGDGDDNDDDDNNNDNVNTDGVEEAFREWQRAHAQQADHAAQEAQARAHWTFCSSIFYLITITLTVAKLEDSYDGDEGFNAFWVLFPTFLITGLLVCCCCMVIYVTPDMSKWEEYAAQQQGGNDNEEEQAEAAQQQQRQTETDNTNNVTANIVIPEDSTGGDDGTPPVTSNTNLSTLMTEAKVDSSAPAEEAVVYKDEKGKETTTTNTTTSSSEAAASNTQPNSTAAEAGTQEEGQPDATGDINDLD